MNKYFLFLVLIIPVLTISCTSEKDTAWLNGEWLHTYDPDGDSDDILSFTSDGEFITTEVSSGKKIKGTYTLEPKVIKVELINKGRVFMKLDLTYDENKDKLYYKSKDTGNTSHYTRKN